MEALVRQRPTSPADLAGIKGLGRARIERYGGPILEAIAGHPITSTPANPNAPALRGEPEQPESPPTVTPVASPEPPCPTAADPAPAQTQTATTSEHVSTEEWTWRLLDRGFSIEEASAIRGLDPAVVARHLTWMVRRGRGLAVESFLPPETVAAWDAWSASHPDGPAPDEPAVSASLWPLFRACRIGR